MKERIDEKIEKYLGENTSKDVLSRGVIGDIIMPKHELGRTKDVKKRLEKRGYSKKQIENLRDKVKKITKNLADEMNVKYVETDENFHGLGLKTSAPIEEFGKELKKKIKKELG